MKFLPTPLLVISFILACSSDSPTSPPVRQPVALVNAFPALNFDRPMLLTHSNDGSNRIFVVEQPGVIRVVANDSTATQADVFLDITDRVNAGGEMGLLGLAFHPDFSNNGFLFVNYTTTRDGPRRTVISRFTASGAQADANSELRLLEVEQPFSNHNGGMIEFGNDGYLYIALGDGGSGGDPRGHGQNKTTLLGAIARIDVDNPGQGRNYGIPPENPFVGDGGGVREEIYAFGLRNPWRFSIDRPTGQIWAGDVGQGQWEEIDLIERGGNYGWRNMEGNHCFDPSSGCENPEFVAPITEYGHSDGNCSVTGGYVYRGTRRPELQGAYIYGDFCSGTLWQLRYDNGQLTENSELVSTSISISSFGIDEQGELYILDLSGSIYRFSAATTTSVDVPLLQPQVSELRQNYPNPFNPETRIEYTLADAGFVKLSVYNAAGQNIRSLFAGRQTQGSHQTSWDGRNNLGEVVASGVYFYRLQANGRIETKRMAFSR